MGRWDKTIMKMECLLSWAAGFWEGEGCVQIAKSRNYSLHVTLTNTKLLPLQKFLERWGGTIRVHGRGNERHSVSYRWSANNITAERFLRDIRPYVLFRSEQINIGIALMKNMARRGELNPSSQRFGGGLLQAEEIAYREMLYLKLKALNKRGPDNQQLPMIGRGGAKVL